MFKVVLLIPVDINILIHVNVIFCKMIKFSHCIFVNNTLESVRCNNIKVHTTSMFLYSRLAQDVHVVKIFLLIYNILSDQVTLRNWHTIFFFLSS